MENREFLEVSAQILAPLSEVWTKWTQAAHVVNWNFAHESWCCPKAEVDFKVGGSSNYRMEAKDNSFGFDFEGRYTDVKTNECIEYVISDGRKVQILFEALNDETHITETFEAEEVHPTELQQDGWQAILNNFKRYTETH